MLETHAAVLVPVAFALGLFYAVGGTLHMRSLVMDAMVDGLLAALGDRDAGKERQRTRIMTIGAALTFASGLSLMAMSRWTLPIFALNAALQGGYLIWAARVLPPQDESEREGRRSTLRAFFIYLAALGLVIALHRLGVWRIWIEPAFMELAAIALSTLMVSWFFRRRSGPAGDAIPAMQQPASRMPPVDMPPPECLRLAPEYHCSPLWDDERGNMLDIAGLGLSAELVDRVRAWDAAFQATYREDDPLDPFLLFPDVAAERAWVREGKAIAEDLGREWAGPLNVQISALDMLVRDARHDLSSWTPTPDERTAWIGERCGVAEIEAAIARLDELSRERDGLPEWDGDSQDDIAWVQSMFRRILACVPPRYIEDVAAGLESAEWGTRLYVAGALAAHERDAALPLLRGALATESDAVVCEILARTIEAADDPSTRKEEE